MPLWMNGLDTTASTAYKRFVWYEGFKTCSDHFVQVNYFGLQASAKPVHYMRKEIETPPN